VPKPFAIVTYWYSEPRLIPAASPREAEALAPEMTRLLQSMAPND
jgi:hypothetical protein